MKKYINTAITHPLISGSMIIFVGSFFSNIFNFIFNLFMGRNLSVSEYGTLISLTSLILLDALIAESFVPTIINFSASLFAQNNLGKARSLFLFLFKTAFGIGSFFLIISTLFRNDIANFFKIEDSFILIMVGAIVLVGFLSTLNRAFLQAKLHFKYVSLIIFLSSFIKLSVGIILIFMGYKIWGAMSAFLIASFFSTILFIIPLRFLFRVSKESIEKDVPRLLSYGTKSALCMIALTFLITTDVVLVKHFFSPEQAGLYAGLSLIGKVVFYFSSPVGMVMFPLIVQRHARGEKYENLFKLSIFLIFLASSVIVFFYFLLPDFTIKLFLKKAEYLSIAPLLGYYGLFIALYSLLYILVNFFLSTNRTKIYNVIILSAIFQAVSLWFFHENFSQIIFISLISVFFSIVVLLLYYFKLYVRKEERT